MREFNGQYLREVLQAERLSVVGRFASSIVHDLKNPLAIISIAAEMAGLETATPAARRDSERRIVKQVDRITAMVNDILEFTRGNPHTIVLVPEDYGAFVTSVIEDLRLEIAHKAARIELSLPLRPRSDSPWNPPRFGRVLTTSSSMPSRPCPTVGRRPRSDSRSPIPRWSPRLATAAQASPRRSSTGSPFRAICPFWEDHRDRPRPLHLSPHYRGTITAASGQRNEPAAGAVFSFTLPRR
jgi:hypothetical protein